MVLEVSKTKLEKNLDEIFGLPKNTVSISESKTPMDPKNHGLVVVDQPEDNYNVQAGDIDNDYRYARENLYDIIENGSHALHELVEIAKSSEHPRAFEVVASLMKTLTDANKDLLEVQAKVKKLKQEDGIPTGPSNVTNALFVGSTTELQNMLKDNLEDKS